MAIAARAMPAPPQSATEKQRLVEAARRERNWQRWGAYLADRQWGTVREDYSADGDSWAYFTHEDARSRAYRWGEDGMLGLCDRECRLCFGLALWNGRDPFLKERLFGLTNGEGNHGEDLKECHFHLDATPTHSWLRGLYAYPQAEFPYAKLREENRRRSRAEKEYELLHTGVFDDNRYWDVEVTYAKAGPDDVLIEINVTNRGPEPATLHLLPTLWFRNTWAWGNPDEDVGRPSLHLAAPTCVQADHPTLGRFYLECETPAAERPRWLFTENETNAEALFASRNSAPFVKDAFHRHVVSGEAGAVNPDHTGTKCALHTIKEVAPGGTWRLRLRLRAAEGAGAADFGREFDAVLAARRAEADAFYDEVLAAVPAGEPRRVARLAAAGLLWSHQFYHYVVRDWLAGDPAQPAPPPQRLLGRNHDWPQLYARDVLSMPDKWEYPWFAAWDLAFQMVPLAPLDPELAKHQLNLLLREWYMHPNGQLPAYEYAFGDVNPPVHAWACWRVYKLTGPRGGRDRAFLQRVFQKLLLNFTWWINRKDPQGNHLFSGGFLGLDNIGVFDRSQPLPHGSHLEQADGTAWMAFYCGTMLSIALELAREDPAYEDIASKFFEHFVAIAEAMNSFGGTGLWHEEDGFYYDVLQIDGRRAEAMRLRSIVGIIPLFAAEVIDDETLAALPGFAKRTRWFLKHRQGVAETMACLLPDPAKSGRRLLALAAPERLRRVLRRVFDEAEFLSPHGVRSLSKHHAARPYVFGLHGQEQRVGYEPGASPSGLFGGNSNWRGPVWFPLNFLLIEVLRRYHYFYGDTFRMEYPTGSGRKLNLGQIADDLAARLGALFLPDAHGVRPALAAESRFAADGPWRDRLWFHEYFHGDTGEGLGANHQTGWTALVLKLLATGED